MRLKILDNTYPEGLNYRKDNFDIYRDFFQKNKNISVSNAVESATSCSINYRQVGESFFFFSAKQLWIFSFFFSVPSRRRVGHFPRFFSADSRETYLPSVLTDSQGVIRESVASSLTTYGNTLFLANGS